MDASDIDGIDVSKYIWKALKIDLRNLGDIPSSIEAKYCREDSLNPFDGVVLKSDITGTFTISRAGSDEYLIDGTVKGVQEFECSRTLHKFDSAFEVPVKVLAKKSKSADAPEYDDEDEELYIIIVPSTSDEVDISECIRQQIILYQPMNPIANPDEDFSWDEESKAEASAEEKIDSRWSELEKLKEKFKKKNNH